MNLNEQELKMLAELLTGGIKDEVITADPRKLVTRTALMAKGLASYAKDEDFGWAEQPSRNYLLPTPAGRAAYSAWANRNTDSDDAKEDNQTQADPGPLFRMVTHIKEAGMVAYRLGYNGARATINSGTDVSKGIPTSQIYSQTELRSLLERALGKNVSTEVVDAFWTFLVNQIEHGVIAGAK